MPLVLANRVQETGTANTTVSFTLAGAVTGFQSFAVIGDTNTTYYSATDGSGNWEVGVGTYSTTGPTLTRTTIYASSNSNLAVTFSGAVNVFVTYPSGRSVNLNESGNVSALGTVSSGTWQGSTVGVAYGGTGVTTSSGANSVVLRDANQNITVNRVSQSNTSTTAAGGTTALTAASSYIHTLVGTGGQTFTMPDATTLTTGVAFVFNNMATGTLTIQNYAAGSVGTIPAGGAGAVFLTDNSTAGGIWDIHAYLPEGVTFGTNALNLGSVVVSGGTWQGGTITPAYGGTGLTSFTTNGAVYATGTTTLTSGTLPVISGGTGTVSVPTNGQLLIGNGSNYTVATLGSGTGISTTVGSGTLTINNTGVTSLAGTSPVTASASTGSVTMSLASGYGDTQNPYASKTANFFLAAPNGTAGAPTFRAIVAADIPTLNQNTTGSAGSVVNAVTFNNGGSGDASGTTFNGSAARTISYNTVGAPSTGGANATGTWGISISGNAATATTASNVNNGTLSMGVSGTGLSGSASFTANQSGNSTFTVTSNATNANTASTIVARDASGNFSAGTITATLSGSATSAGSVSNSVTFNNGGAGGASGSTFNGSGALTVSYNTVGAPSTTGTNASGTWGINVTGNAATATTATTANALNTGNSYTVAGLTVSTGSAYVVANRTSSGSGQVGYNWAQAGSNLWWNYVDTSGTTLNWYNSVAVANVMTLTTGGALNTAGAITQNGSQVLTAGNYNSYAPTLTGGGASGTWGINITGNAATITSQANSATITASTAATANQIVLRDSNGDDNRRYGFASYFNMSHGVSGATGDTIFYSSTDDYIRKNNATGFRASLNVPTRTGGDASGTWGISISGNAATATTASNVNNGTLTMNVSGTGLSGSQTFTANQSSAATFTVTSNATNANTGSTIVARDASGNFSAGTITATLSGNASTATSATSATSATTATNVAGGAANRIVFNTGAGASSFVVAPTTSSTYLSWNGSAFAWAAVSGGVTVSDDTSTNATRYLTFTSATSGSISTVNVSSTKLTYNPSTGALSSTTVAGSSDERLKKNWRDLPHNFIEELSQVKAGIYDRTDHDVPITQVGVTAQSLQAVLPDAVISDNDGMLSVAYGNAALVAAIKLAERVVEQEARINRLEALVAKLVGD